MIQSLTRVFSLYVIIEKMINVHLGLYKHQRCFIIAKKTIYYDNAVIKIYDLPIFYLPKLSHPDPSVDRRTGFLVPTSAHSKNLGFGVSVPYFVNLSNDKNFTLLINFMLMKILCSMQNITRYLKTLVL